MVPGSGADRRIAASPVAVDDVLGALARVRDPELDEPITQLRFVAGVRIDGAAVEVDLRLPTFFCAPNFAYLMVADARDEVAAVPGVTSVAVRLADHFAAEEINAGVSAGAGFAGSFPGLADGELDRLRTSFTRKAHLACQERVAATLLRSGLSATEIGTAVLGDVPPGPDLDRLARRRAELGLPADPGAPVFVDDDGARVPASPRLPGHWRLARTTRVSIEGNSTFCRGLLSVRYGLSDQAQPSAVTGGTHG